MNLPFGLLQSDTNKGFTYYKYSSFVYKLISQMHVVMVKKRLSDREVCGATHNWPSVVRVREGLASRDVLVSSGTSDSCGGPGAMRDNQGCQLHGVSSDTLVRLASGLDACCVKKQCGLVGLCIGARMTFNLRLS
jgi:hypothetical protein